MACDHRAPAAAGHSHPAPMLAACEAWIVLEGSRSGGYRPGGCAEPWFPGRTGDWRWVRERRRYRGLSWSRWRAIGSPLVTAVSALAYCWGWFCGGFAGGVPVWWRGLPGGGGGF